MYLFPCFNFEHKLFVNVHEEMSFLLHSTDHPYVCLLSGGALKVDSQNSLVRWGHLERTVFSLHEKPTSYTTFLIGGGTVCRTT